VARMRSDRDSCSGGGGGCDICVYIVIGIVIAIAILADAGLAGENQTRQRLAQRWSGDRCGCGCFKSCLTTQRLL
jgi:hypothetical protein